MPLVNILLVNQGDPCFQGTQFTCLSLQIVTGSRMTGVLMLLRRRLSRYTKYTFERGIVVLHGFITDGIGKYVIAKTSYHLGWLNILGLLCRPLRKIAFWHVLNVLH